MRTRISLSDVLHLNHINSYTGTLPAGEWLIAPAWREQPIMKKYPQHFHALSYCTG
jgi:hypothetical protein